MPITGDYTISTNVNHYILYTQALKVLPLLALSDKAIYRELT